MKPNITLDRDFERCLDEMRSKYGEKFEFINGVHPSQLDYSVFMNRFKDAGTLADVSSDPSANARNLDLRSFLSEKEKPYNKIFGMSKIFYEVKKKWGLKTAKEWYDQEYSKGFYLNDASASSSFYPYTYSAKEVVEVLYNGRTLLLPLDALYTIIDEEEVVVDKEKDVTQKYPMFLFVKDKDNKLTRITAVTKKRRHRPLVRIKTAFGEDLVVTDNHPMITNFDDANDTTEAKDSEGKMQLRTGNDIEFRGKCVLDLASILPSWVESSTSYIKYNQATMKRYVQLNRELGYVVGFFIGDGGYVNSTKCISYTQNNKETLENLNNLFFELFGITGGIYVSSRDVDKKYTLTINNKYIFELFRGYFKIQDKAQNKTFPLNILEFNEEFAKGCLEGLIDSDGTIVPEDSTISIRMSSRAGILQATYLFRYFGYSIGNTIQNCPFGNNKKIQTKYTLWGINATNRKGATPLDHSYKVKEKLTTAKESNLKYKRSGEATITSVKEIEESSFYEQNKYIYDITTESHTFECNNIWSHNCYAVDLSRLAREGLFFLKDYNAQPPKHLTTFLDDVIEFVSFLSNRQSGAVGLPNIIVWMWYFWNKDCEEGYYIKDPEYYFKQSTQKLIYRLNQPFLRIDQSSFTNVSIFDRCYLESLFGGLEFPDGSFGIDHIEDIIAAEKTFMEVVVEIRKESMFTYPVFTYSLLYKDGRFQDGEFARWCSDTNVEWSDSNFFVSDNVGVLSNCCRLLSDTSKLSGFINSIGGTALSIGSVRVNTINLVRIAYESNLDKEEYLRILKDRVILDCKVLYSIRHIIKRNIEKGLLPNYQDGALELDKQYCTIGILGLYEVMDLLGLIAEDELDNKYYTDEAIEFASKIFNVINETKDSFTDEFSYNVESIPGENCAGTICAADNLLFDTDKYYIYSNQWIPLREKCTLAEKCKLSAILDNKCSGGAIAHINIEGRFSNGDMAWDMLNYVAQQGVIYFAFNTKISVCEHRHAFIGTEKCPKCGGSVADTFTRVVGFYTPVSGYQEIRRKEFDERKWYTIEDGIIS